MRSLSKLGRDDVEREGAFLASSSNASHLHPVAFSSNPTCQGPGIKMDFDTIKAGITSQATKMAELEAKVKKLEKVETELLAKVVMLESQESFIGKVTANDMLL